MISPALNTEKSSVYKKLCQLASIEPAQSLTELAQYANLNTLANASLSDRMTASLQVLSQMIVANENKIEKIDNLLINYLIGKIDDSMSNIIDAVIHDEQFQKLESLWTNLKYLVDGADSATNIKLELLDVSKEDLRDDFLDSQIESESGLYHHLYKQEYDMPGGEPYASIISDYEIDSSVRDIALLRDIAKVCCLTHCPFIAAAGAGFFHKKDFDEVMNIGDIYTYMERAEYIPWQSFRKEEFSCYIGLTLPNFLLRLPYGEENPVKGFQYRETVHAMEQSHYLWGKASFPFAVNLIRSFCETGWLLRIRGPQSGGRVENMLQVRYGVDDNVIENLTTEAMIPESSELKFSDLGFIPLSFYKNSNYACFFSANSVKLPEQFSVDAATANSRVNVRLPYVYLISRIGHYLKVLQRETIGSAASEAQLAEKLNIWLQTLVTKMNHPGPELIAQYPLRQAAVSVYEQADNPGYFNVNLNVVPHFQVEGMDINLSLVAKMPSNKK